MNPNDQQKNNPFNSQSSNIFQPTSSSAQPNNLFSGLGNGGIPTTNFSITPDTFKKSNEQSGLGFSFSTQNQPFGTSNQPSSNNTMNSNISNNNPLDTQSFNTGQATFSSSVQSFNNQPLGTQTSDNPTFNSQSLISKVDTSILKTQEVPLAFRQKSLNEIISSLTKTLEENTKEFKQKASEVFSYDEKIIQARNNYCKITQMIDEEERKIAEMEENVEFFEKWLDDFSESVGAVKEEGENGLVNCISEVERLVDDFNLMVEAMKDEDDEVMRLVNENMKLIEIIDKGLTELEG
ncbi:hypothetical protein TCON_2486 [Astathelohania contejeani]|uniref:Nucleoporin NSP1-like C-terminal domain-containing protein n=1 Tax=Astathelohania contejeani TaxID=164912 RepID=A0ABQ7HVW8_9MICR|nr:hypothetical protein TCON_2486 [Thelohania contejeani]